LIDPGRDPADDPATGDHTTPAGPLETTWTIGAKIRARTREHTDLLTPHTTRALDHAWRTHQHTHGDGAGVPPPTPPDRRARRIIPPHPPPHEADPPFSPGPEPAGPPTTPPTTPTHPSDPGRSPLAPT